MSLEQPPSVEPIPGLKDEYPTKDGRAIHITPIGREHMRAHMSVIPLLDEAMAQVELPKDGSGIAVAVDLHRPLEKATKVETPDIGLDGEAWFAKRHNRLGATHIVLDGDSEQMVSTVVIIAKPPVADQNKYLLRSAYIGTTSPPEPYAVKTEEERAVALGHWSTHALVYTPSDMGAPFRSTWRQVLAESAAMQSTGKAA